MGWWKAKRVAMAFLVEEAGLVLVVEAAGKVPVATEAGWLSSVLRRWLMAKIEVLTRVSGCLEVFKGVLVVSMM